VLAPDVRFEGFGYDDWTRFLELWRPQRPEGKARDPNRAQGVVIAVHAHGKLRKLIHSQVGRLRLDDLAPDWPIAIDELARRHHASYAITLEHGALQTVMDELGAKLRREDDLSRQWLLLFGLLREQLKRGAIATWPARLSGVPLPTANVVERSLDMVCPPGKTLLLGLFDKGELWTSIALRRAPNGIDLMLGPQALRGELGLLSGDFRRDHRHLARVVSDVAGPLSFGCFADHQTFKKLEVDPTPGAWALAVAVRDVVLSPVPAAMALPLGLDAGRAAFSALRQAAARLDPAGVLAPALDAIRDVASGDRKVEEVLGFHPLELLRRLLSRER
jgi:hypothetical protein